MITGVGTDIVSVARLAEAYARHGERFLSRLLHPSEQADLPENPTARSRFLARRWAAKEAFAKAMGTGVRGELALNAVMVQHDELGRPSLEFAPGLNETVKARGLTPHLSISDESDFAVAFVVIEGPPLSGEEVPT
jgi:holo-[acyl-carrier protein] synthase